MDGIRAVAPTSLHIRDAESIQVYARIAGLLGVLSFFAGGFGEAYVPSLLTVAGDPAATARNILASESLFRWGFAGYLVEALCDAALTMVFYVLLRPVHRNLAMAMVVFRIISTCGFASAQLLHFAALPVLQSSAQAAAFGPDSHNALAFTLLTTSVLGQSLFTMFYGVATALLGWLVFRSTFLPRVFGILLIAMGIAFTARTFLVVLAPAYASPLLLAFAAVAFPPFIVWLLVKGVNVARWREQAAAS
jgi:hypothetical protein